MSHQQPDDTVSVAEMRRLERARRKANPRPNKYRARAVEEDGYRFASQREHERYGELRVLAAQGIIADLTVHPRWVFVVNNVRVGAYTADFSYIRRTEDGHPCIVEDVKSGPTRTESYRLRVKLLWALYHIRVEEVT